MDGDRSHLWTHFTSPAPNSSIPQFSYPNLSVCECVWGNSQEWGDRDSGRLRLIAHLQLTIFPLNSHTPFSHLPISSPSTPHNPPFRWRRRGDGIGGVEFAFTRKSMKINELLHEIYELLKNFYEFIKTVYEFLKKSITAEENLHIWWWRCGSCVNSSPITSSQSFHPPILISHLSIPVRHSFNPY